jgi:hypothetical protein
LRKDGFPHLGIQFLGDGCGADDVGEEDGDGLALTFDLRRAAFIFSRNSWGAVFCSDLSFDSCSGSEISSTLFPQRLQNVASGVFDVPHRPVAHERLTAILAKIGVRWDLK